ncbi:MAG: nucleoside triphosphate pyrophosphohydrolase [Chloroflexota bacterium]
MDFTGITLLGLGPGDPDLLTQQAWRILASSQEIYLRTRHHPVVGGFPEGLQVHSFDALYENGASFEDVYESIIVEVLSLGRRPQGVIYAVPGHPFVAEATAPEIARRARIEGLPVQVVEGLSFLEPVCTAVLQDPFPHTVLIDALELTAKHVPVFSPDAPAIIAQIHSKMVAADVKLTLNALYPDEHQVVLVHAAGTPQQVVENLALYEIDRSAHIGLLTALYVPPLGPATSFEAFQEVIARLRAPDGCPWDREQTHQSLRSQLVEETYEVLAALDAGDVELLREELGDLLLHIVMHAQIASEYGEFTMAEVLQGINAKLVHRHPHVFGELQVENVQSVLQNWERLKADERAANHKADKGLLDGVALALPALVQAEQYQQRAARVGFDWPELQGVLDKLDEELREVQEAVGDVERFAEVGDLLFAAVNMARWYKVDAESALREANARFRKRFSYIEKAAREQERSVSDLSLDEMEALWRAAKKI